MTQTNSDESTRNPVKHDPQQPLWAQYSIWLNIPFGTKMTTKHTPSVTEEQQTRLQLQESGAARGDGIGVVCYT